MLLQIQLLTPPIVDLTKLGPEQLAAVKQQIDQEFQHFNQSLQALTLAKNKFQDCIDDIKSISAPENKHQQIMVPASASLYIPGKITENKKFIVDIGTGYYVEKTDKEAISFYEQKIQKLNKESVQIQNIIKEKTTASLAIEAHIRQIAASQHEERVRQQSQQNDAK